MPTVNNAGPACNKESVGESLRSSRVLMIREDDPADNKGFKDSNASRKQIIFI